MSKKPRGFTLSSHPSITHHSKRGQPRATCPERLVPSDLSRATCPEQSRGKSREVEGSRGKSRGFTLIELLVVVFIVGLLAALVIVNVSQARKSGRDAKRVANLKAIQTALEMYAEKNTSYPDATPSMWPGWRGACPGRGGYSTSGSNGWIPNLAPDFIPVIPTDPKQKSDTECYIYRTNGTDYMVIAVRTMETCPAGCGYSENTSIKEMSRPITPTEASIAVYSSGAWNW